MKRLLFVLLFAGAAAVGAYTLYFHQRMAGEETEHQWLKREFALNDAQMAEIDRLEMKYQPVCDGHCSDYLLAHARLESLLARSTVWRPEIGQAMEALSRSQMECHRDMLKHAYEVSSVMQPDSGRRYLAMVMSQLALTASDRTGCGTQ